MPLRRRLMQLQNDYQHLLWGLDRTDLEGKPLGEAERADRLRMLSEMEREIRALQDALGEGEDREFQDKIRVLYRLIEGDLELGYPGMRRQLAKLEKRVATLTLIGGIVAIFHVLSILCQLFLIFQFGR